MRPIPVFKLKDESGLPFDSIGLLLAERGLVPDWEDFFARAWKAGWTEKQIFKSVQELAGPLKFTDDPAFRERARTCFELVVLRQGK